MESGVASELQQGRPRISFQVRIQHKRLIA
jgi:hypothetical protein